ncbi:MAG: cadherin domain-containing protein, partial [Chloroflexi bacterium]|nr:cadherin domain-containing protein [Chloroflexota bacterium]
AAVTSTATGVAAVRTKSGLPSTGAANHKVDGSRTQAPAATNKAPTFPANAPASLSVAENNAAGAPVGRVSATDSDGDALTYKLDSASDALFDIDSSGNITVTAANALDYETKADYTVTVSVHDGKDGFWDPDTAVDATHSLTIAVTDVEEATVANRAPTFPATAPSTLEVAENNAAGALVGTVAATDPDGDALTYALDSASDAVFDIDSSGAITVTAANALDDETKASYEVTVSVHDGKDAAGAAGATGGATHSATITVTDVPAVQETPEPVAARFLAGRGRNTLTSIEFWWRLPVQPAGVTVSAVEVQVLPSSVVGRSWRTVASLAPVADGGRMSHTVIGLNPGEWFSVRIRLITNSGNADLESHAILKYGLPKPVADLSVSNVTRTTVDLSWTLPRQMPASPPVRELRVQQRGANGDWTTVATLPDDSGDPVDRPPPTDVIHCDRTDCRHVLHLPHTPRLVIWERGLGDGVDDHAGGKSEPGGGPDGLEFDRYDD